MNRNSKTTILAILQELCELLPFVGEDGTASSRSEEEIYTALLQHFPKAMQDIEISMTVCRLFFHLANLLDSDMLERGEWRFVSYPARTVAVSALRMLLRSAKEKNYSIIPQAFWTEPGDNARLRRQLLAFMAERLAGTKHEPPVRISHVSFALLRCGDYFLCYKRELDNKDPDRIQGNLVLPGGRLNTEDMPPELSQQEKLHLLSAPEGLGHYAEQAHENALRRELKEELGLAPHLYDITEFARFQPYHGRYGGGDCHAWTRTTIWLYEVVLHPEAVTTLQPYFTSTHFGYWASAEELWQLQNEMGEKIFFDACRENMSSAHELKKARESFPFLHASSSQEECILLPDNTTLPVEIRVAKEKKAGRPRTPIRIAVDEKQSQLLLALGLAQRSMIWPRTVLYEEQNLILQQDKAEECTVVLGGLQLHSSELRNLYASLPKEIRKCCSVNAGYYRLCSRLYFPQSFFSYEIASPYYVSIYRKQIDLPLLGITCPELVLQCNLSEGVFDIFSGKEREGSYDLLRGASDKLTGKKLKDRIRNIGLFRLFGDSGIGLEIGRLNPEH